MARRWSDEDRAYMWAHPDMTAAEVAEALGRTPGSVQKERERSGRWQRGSTRLCVACDERVVWVESRKASRLGLCKGCWLREERARLEEDAEYNRVRQLKHKLEGGRP